MREKPGGKAEPIDVLLRKVLVQLSVTAALSRAVRDEQEKTNRKLDLVAAELEAARRDFKLMGRNMRKGKERARQRRIDEAAKWEPAHPYLEDWNRVAAERGDLRRALKYTPRLVEQLKEREKEGLWVERWPRIVEEVRGFSPDLLKDGSWFDLGWLSGAEDRYVKLLEGKYRGRATRGDDDGASIVKRTAGGDA